MVGMNGKLNASLITGTNIENPGAEPGIATVKELQEFVKLHIAPYKYPRKIEFVDTLPRTETGKLQRFKLRQGG